MRQKLVEHRMWFFIALLFVEVINLLLNAVVPHSSNWQLGLSVIAVILASVYLYAVLTSLKSSHKDSHQR